MFYADYALHIPVRMETLHPTFASGLPQAIGGLEGRRQSDERRVSPHVAGSDRYRAPRAVASRSEGHALYLRRKPENDAPVSTSVWTERGEERGYVPRVDGQALAGRKVSLPRFGASTAPPDIAVDIGLTLPG